MKAVFSLDAASGAPARSLSLAMWIVVAAVPLLFPVATVPLILGFMLAYLIEPVVKRVARWKIGGRVMPRAGAVLVVYFVAFVGVYGFVSGAGPKVAGELAGLARTAKTQLAPQKVRQALDRASNLLGGWAGSSESPRPALNERPVTPGAQVETSTVDEDEETRRGHAFIDDLVEHSLDAVGNNVGGIVVASQRVVRGLASFVFFLVLITMLTAFIAVDFPEHVQFFRRMVPPAQQTEFDAITEVLDRALAGAIRGQAIVCVVNGVLTFAGLWLFGVKFALVLATIAAVFTVIPIFGTILSSIPIVLIALTGGLSKGLAALGWIIVIHLLEANVFNPKIVGDQARVHPALVVFALIAGESTFGLVGALLAIPAVAIVVGLLRYGQGKLNPEM